MQIPAPSASACAAPAPGRPPREEGIKIAHEALLAARPLAQGVYIMPPFGRIEGAFGAGRASAAGSFRGSRETRLTSQFRIL